MIVFLGLAGSGKSTQSQILARTLNCPWLSTGQLLRDNVKDKLIRQKMLKGEMLSDAVLLPLLERQLKTLKDSEFILDGSPRTLHQTVWLIDKIKRYKIQLIAVIHLKASKAIVKARLLARGRPDDTPAAIDERFKEYDKSIVSILNYFRENNFPVYEINGERSPVDVDQAILKAIGR